VGITAAISKGWGKGGKTVLSFSHAFPQTVISTALFFARAIFQSAFFAPFQRSPETK
jgi:hypothetical protein